MRDLKFPTGWGWSPEHPWRARGAELGPMPGRRTTEPLATLAAGLEAALAYRSELVFELLLASAPPLTTACLFTAGWIQAVGGTEEDLRLEQLDCLWALIDDCQRIAWQARADDISDDEAYNSLAWARDVLASQRQGFSWLEDPRLLTAAAEVTLP